MIYYFLCEGSVDFDLSKNLNVLDLNHCVSLSKSRVVEKKQLLYGLTRVLKNILGDSIADYKVLKLENGKPYLKNTTSFEEYYISYSHSKGHFALAFSKDTDVGLDLELKSRFEGHQAYKKWLHTDEVEYLESVAYDPSVASLIWTKKEALTKLTGLGYKLEFKSLSVIKSDQIEFENKKINFKTEDLNTHTLSFSYYAENDKVDVVKLD